MNRKEIKVRQHSTNAGFCYEIWEGQSDLNRTIWLYRNTPSGDWGYLSSGPEGYCEPEGPLSKDIDIIICNSDWVEFYRTGNDKERFPDEFPTFEEVCQQHWNTIKHRHLPIIGTHEHYKWLEKAKPDNISDLDKLNWSLHRYKNIDPENIMEDSLRVSREDKGDFKTTLLLMFEYMGKNYHIVRIAKQHTMCHARWYEYAVVFLKEGRFNNLKHWFGYGLINNK